MDEPALIRPYRVRFEEATPAHTVRTAQYLAWFSDVAWQHSIALGVDRAWYDAHGLNMVIRATSLEVLRPVRLYEEVGVGTRVAGWRRVVARRESVVRSASGELLARGEIDWVAINDRGMPCRWPAEFQEIFGGAEEAFEVGRVALPEVPDDAPEARFTVRRRDLDPLDHVNNSVYVDYLEEALEQAGQGALLEAYPRRYTLDFAGSAERGDTVIGRTWPADGGWYYSLRREDGSALLRARLEV